MEEQPTLISGGFQCRYTRENCKFMLDDAEQNEACQSKSTAVWIAAAWLSFLIWLVHSFAVRAFLDSLHVVSKALGGS